MKSLRVLGSILVALAATGCPLGTVSKDDLEREAPYAFGTIALDVNRIRDARSRIEGKLGAKKIRAEQVAFLGTTLEVDAEDPSKQGQELHVYADADEGDVTVRSCGALDEDTRLFSLSDVPLDDLPKMIERALVPLDDPNAAMERVTIGECASVVRYGFLCKGDENEVVIAMEFTHSRYVVFDLHGKTLHVKW